MKTLKKFISWLQFIIDNIKSLFGFDKMSKNFITFSTIHLGFLMFYTLQMVFMNTLLRRFSDGDGVIYLYNMMFFSFIPVGMMLASFSIKKRSHIFTMKSSLYLWIGIAIVTLSLIITKQLHHFWILLSVVSSLANGCYWIAYYIALTEYTDINNRDCGLSIIGIYTGIANVIIPLIGGYIIKIFTNYTGYIIMYSFAFLVSIISIFFTHRFIINEDQQKNPDTDIHIIVALKLIFKDKIWLYSSLSEFFRGIRDGVFIFLLNVLMFSVTNNEALVGINAFIAGVINIISNWILGKILYKNSGQNNKVKLLIIAVSSLFLSSLLLLKLNIITLIIMTCINAFFTIFIQNITQSVFCLSVQVNEESNKLKTESFVLKSYFLAIGRLIGIVLLFMVPKTNLYMVLGIIFLSVIQFGAVITTNKTIYLIDNLKEN